MIRAVLAAALLAAPAAAADRGFPVGAFDRISVAGSQEVTVATGHAPSVRASGDSEALDRLDIRVEGGVLKIGSKHDAGWSWRNHGPVHVAVTVPMVRGVDLAGSGSVTIDRVKTQDFDGELSGSGRLSVAAFDADRVQLGVSGSGSATLAGRCGSMKANLQGSGDLKLADLRCETISANTAGSGSIAAQATRTAALSTAGSGDIHLTGGARCTVSTAGSGRVNCS
ncbi:MAG: DUF2807 domain-containing protein [Sphingomonadaceae bacterium]|nr:DUF2807 domain-containing protein [Sphingomonadaceae bacterium]